MDKGLLALNAVNIRDFAEEKRKGRVDDYSYGGGAGMIMQAEPVYRAYLAVAQQIRGERSLRVLYMSPQGRRFDQQFAGELAKEEDLVFLCGHYEGIDERVLEEINPIDVSIGDYVLTGGELAAAVMTDSIVRIIPGAIGDEQSALSDSFQDNLLAAPVYTRPAEYRGWRVPDVLLSGHEARIKEWELQQSLERTRRLRPDLLKR
jgi:tRNA (guanine37-N1)-methyltransferase